MIYLHVVVLCFTAVKPHPSLAFGDWQTCVRALGSCSLQFFQWEAWPLGLTISLDSGMSRKFFSFSFFFREKLDLIILTIFLHSSMSRKFVWFFSVRSLILSFPLTQVCLGSFFVFCFQWEAWPRRLTVSLDSSMSRKFFFFFSEKLDLIIDCFPWLKYLKSVLFAGNSQQCLPQFSDRKILQRYQTLGHFLFLWFAPGLPVVYTQYWLKHDWMLTMQVKQEMFPQKDSQLWITVNSHSWSENQ